MDREMTVGTEVDKSGPIRRFIDSGLQKSIDDAVGQLGDEHHVAIVGFWKDGRLGAATVARIGKQWSVVGAVEKDPKLGWSKEVAVRWAI